MERLTRRLSNGDVVAWNPLEYYNYNDFKKVLELLAEYEDIGTTPDELKMSVYLYLEMSKKMRRIVKDMKYYLDANEEDGVVYIPKFVIEEIVYDR